MIFRQMFRKFMHAGFWDRIVPAPFISHLLTMRNFFNLDRKEKIKKYNLSKLDKLTLDEIQKFDNFVTKFGQKSASDQLFRENLI